MDTDHKPTPHITFLHQYRTCNKGKCRLCPHGPYWYAYWREDGKLTSGYIGNRLGDPHTWNQEEVTTWWNSYSHKRRERILFRIINSC